MEKKKTTKKKTKTKVVNLSQSEKNFMTLATEVDALRNDVITCMTAIKAIPMSQNMLMALARLITESKLFAETIKDIKGNKEFEKQTAIFFSQLSGKKVEDFNKNLIKKSK